MSWCSALSPAAPPERAGGRGRLRYRDFLTVGLIIDSADTFPDNWIYVHSPNVKVGRIQNFRAWSPDMIPDAAAQLARPRVLRAGRGRDLEHARRGSGRARPQRSGGARPGQGRTGVGRMRDPHAKGLSGLRRSLQGAHQHDPRTPRESSVQSAGGRPQRPAPLQQSGSLDADRHLCGSQHPGRERGGLQPALRHLARQHHEGLSRGGLDHRSPDR